MSLGGNLSSGYTARLNDAVITSGISKSSSIAYSQNCSGIVIPGNPPVASYPSMILLSRTCPTPTPAQFALYPKSAVPSSIRTQALSSPSCATLPSPNQRFAQYQRYQVPVPCAPLPQSANMAGISRPSSLECNIYPRT